MKQEEYKEIILTLDKSLEGKTVHVRGWVYRIRDQKEMVFIILRDSSDVIQCVVKKESVPKKVWEAALKLTMESSCTLTGKIREDKRAPTGFELQVSDLEIVGLAERFPITKDKSEEFLRDVRHLWLRSRKETLILEVRAAVFEAIHQF
ncbi:MAG: OB-fold nucleic acid binding domain-containing protein, partial [Nanoarchaeota archaeon]